MTREDLKKHLEPNYLAIEQLEIDRFKVEQDILKGKLEKKINQYQDELIGLSQDEINRWILNKLAKLEI